MGSSNNTLARTVSIWFSISAATALLCGCSSTGEKSPGPSPTAASQPAAAPPPAQPPAAQAASTPPPSAPPPAQRSVHYVTPDGRTISIGAGEEANGGAQFKEPHMEKCWLADGFNFRGYDVLYIAPIQTTAKYNPDGTMAHSVAVQTLMSDLNNFLAAQRIFPRIVTDQLQIMPGSRVLTLNNTIVKYAKGGGAARYWVGIYGGGQPTITVEGVMTDGDKTVFTYTMHRSGVSAQARVDGAVMRDTDIQRQDIYSLVFDLTDFIGAISGNYTPTY